MEMIKTEKVMIKLNSKHIGKYMKRGYKGNVNDIIEINIKFNNGICIIKNMEKALWVVRKYDKSGSHWNAKQREDNYSL